MILTTKRLVLREFEEDDWRAILAYQSDPLYLRYNPWTHRTELDVRAFVQLFLAQREEEPRTKFQFAITLAPDGQLIGNAGIRMRTPDAWEAEIGYELDPRYWGRGYATEAAQALLAFGSWGSTVSGHGVLLRIAPPRVCWKRLGCDRKDAC